MPTYEMADEAVLKTVREVMGAEHEELVKAGVTVQVLMARARTDAYGIAIGPALKHHGYSAAGIVKVLPLKARVAGQADAEILLDGDQWGDWTARRRLAVLDHEVRHLTLVKDKHGTVQRDDAGRPCLRCQLHNWQLGGFARTADLYGLDSCETDGVKVLMDERGQLFWKFLGAREVGSVVGVAAQVPRAMVAAVRDLCPKRPGESIEISVTGPGGERIGEPATLTAEMRGKLTRRLRTVGASA